MKIFCFTSSSLDQNSYLVLDPKNKKGLLVDTPLDPKKIIEAAREYKIQYIFLTHLHYDHIWTASELSEKLGAKIAITRADAVGLNNPQINFSAFFEKSISHIQPKLFLKSGQLLDIGNIRVEVIFSPGHTIGSICLLASQEDEHALFTGDTLFFDGVGRIDLIGGSAADLKESLCKIKKVINEYENIKIYPGHGIAF